MYKWKRAKGQIPQATCTWLSQTELFHQASRHSNNQTTTIYFAELKHGHQYPPMLEWQSKQGSSHASDSSGGSEGQRSQRLDALDQNIQSSSVDVRTLVLVEHPHQIA